MDNLPDDWNSFYEYCPECGEKYHVSEGGCDCEPKDEYDYDPDPPDFPEMDEEEMDYIY